MHDLDKPYTDSIQQWDIACDCFRAEFKFDPNEIITIDTIREMFAELVDGHELSQNASISLMFALYFLGYATLLEIMKAKDDQAVRQIGVEWSIEQSKELKAAGVPCLHYYTMGDNNTVKTIVQAVI